MSQIRVEDLTFYYDGSYMPVFEHTSFLIDTDWRLGFIGRNGRGKTTFLNLLIGKHKYTGKIESSVSFDYFPFEMKEKENLTALETARKIIAPFDEWEKDMEELINEGSSESLEKYGEIQERYEKHDGYVINEYIERELVKLKVNAKILNNKFTTLSFGEQSKIMISALFLKKNNFLLIDEPTNHLDRNGRENLSEYLKNKKGFILVSHDRNFLDKCIDHVLSINKTNIEVYKGNYSVWSENKRLKDEFEEKQNEILLKDIKRFNEAKKRTGEWSDKIEAGKIGSGVYDRGYVGHMAAKMMKRSKAIERRQDFSIEEKKKLLKNIEVSENLRMNILEYPKKKYGELNNINFSYGDRIILDNINLIIEKGDRISIEGGNGSGKSTLLKIILGSLEKFSGIRYIASDLKISYVSQDTSYLRGNLKDFSIKYGLNESVFKTVLRQLDFEREQFDNVMEDFSEGQKKKVLLAKSLSEPSHLFVWDEPLNFIDVLSRVQIEELLLEYKPTMIFVEHDKIFADKIATKIFHT